MWRFVLPMLPLLAPVVAAPAQTTAPAVGNYRWTRLTTVRNAQRVFASTAEPHTVFVACRGAFLMSTDDGRTFAALGEVPGTVTAVLHSPLDMRVIYVGTADRGLFRSDDGGKTFQSPGGRDRGLAHNAIHSLLFASDDPSFTTILATHGARNRGISMSIDGGRTWRVFAEEYGADSIIMSGTTLFFAGLHSAAGAEPGFYRSLDAGRNWFRVLNAENPTALAGSLLRPETAWCGTASGLSRTDDFGVSSVQVGPRSANIACLAVALAAADREIVFAYDPSGHGVMVSDDGFQTFRRVNDGLYVGEWVSEGANMVASLDGRTLYACVNGSLYVARTTAMLSDVRLSPALACIGSDDVTISVRAPRDAKVTVDLSPLFGPAAFALEPRPQDAGDVCTFAGSFRVTDAAANAPPRQPREQPRPRYLPELVPLTVRAAAGQTDHAAVALLWLSSPQRDRVLWNGESADAFAARSSGGLSLARSREQPLSGRTHLRLSVESPGEAAFSWRMGHENAAHHKVLCFFIRSDIEGPTDLRLALLDSGGHYGFVGGRRSNELPLRRYLPAVGRQYQLVAVPLADLIWGGSADPRHLREIAFVQPTAEKRVYDVDDLMLVVKHGPVLSSPQVIIAGDGESVDLRVRVASADPPLRVTARNAAGEETALVAEGSDSGFFSARVPVARTGTGTRTVTFMAADARSTNALTHTVFIPRRSPAVAGRSTGAVQRDADLSEFAGIPPAVFGRGPLAASVRFLLGAKELYIAAEVKDPDFLPPRFRVGPTLDSLAAGPSLEILLTSPSHSATVVRNSAASCDHRIVLGLTDKGALAGWGRHLQQAAGRKTPDGYVIEAAVPQDVLRVERFACDFAPGISTRLEMRLRGASGDVVCFAAPSEKESANPENWGLITFAEGVGPPQMRFAGCSGSSLTLLADRPLDPSSAAVPASYRIEGFQVQSARLDADRRTIRLLADKPVPLRGRFVMSFPGLRGADGSPVESTLTFTAMPGVPLSGDLISACLVARPVEGVEFKSALDAPRISQQERPAAGARWSLLEAQNGIFNLADRFGPLNNAAVVAHVYLYSDAARKVQLWCGSDDGIRIIVNGTIVHDRPGTRACNVDSDKVRGVPLNEGWNSVYVVISTAGGSWEYCLRVMDENGKPPQGISFSVDDPDGGAGPTTQQIARVEEACTGDTTVQQMPFMGWNSAWKLSTRAAETIIVPDVARVMHFSTRGGSNILWVNEQLAGRIVLRDDNQWHNFGGDKVWPTAQDLWIKYARRPGWPPPYEFDCAPAAIEPMPGGARLKTRLSPHFGAQAVREFVPDASRPLLHVRQWFDKREGNPVEMSFWTVTQVCRPAYAMLPLPRGAQQQGFRALGKLLPDRFAAHRTCITLRNDGATPQKVGVVPGDDPDDGWVAAVYADLMLLQSQLPVPKAAYPDGGCHAEVFAANDELGGYVELELLSPLRDLRKGDQLRNDIVWQIVPLTAAQSADPEQAAAVAREAHKTALKLLRP